MTYEEVISHNTAIDIINIIQDIYYGKTDEAIKFRVSYGSNGAVDKIIQTIVEKYIH